MAMWKWIEAGQEQDNQKPLQDLFYRREKSIQKYGSENDIIRTVSLFCVAQIRRFVTGYLK